MPGLYREYKKAGSGGIPALPDSFDASIFDDDTRALLDDVNNVLHGQYSASKLRANELACLGKIPAQL